MPNNKQIHNYNIKFGIYLGVFWIIYFSIFQSIQVFSLYPIISLVIGLLIQTVIITYCILNYKQYHNNILQLNKALKTGMIISVTGGIILAIYHFLLLNIFQYDLSSKITLIYENWILKNRPNLSAKELYDKIRLFQKYNTEKNITIISFLWVVFFGFFISILSGSILHKKVQP
ncbi:DUF4199 domain-containing protein [Aquimarina acroporae]|uniref:DUF4199 domain-containing protein n=1 Tax=Aquimarina acroporae TaxID=2937283 RepID=UPI00374CE980